ncbi:hypothetical protein [Herbiconiux sp. YIM B11900]|uniref:hypothetical protein n=1 Tax=Herbiconiux sp. YIM B11900 TaxID=3404131 RepID=UPI003F866BC1
MGIRYFARPIHADDIELARTDLDAYFRSDRSHQFVCHQEPRPPILDLDKCWRDLQALFWSPPDQPPRPAASLVEGDVKNACCGWEAHRQVLDPETVRAIADDLDSADFPHGLGGGSAESGSGDRHLDEMLARARAFTREVADRGWGMYYSIG